MPDKVTLVRPDGSELTVTNKEAERLRKLGYHDRTDEEMVAKEAARVDAAHYSSFKNKVTTAAEGAASGLTGGLIGGTGRQEQERAKRNPGTRLVSEIVPAIAASIYTGGESIAGTVGRYTIPGIAERLGAKVATGVGGGVKGAVAGAATEGFVGGMGSAITTAKLNNDPVTVESVLTGGGFGAIIAGPVGAVGHGLTKVGSKGVSHGLVDTVESTIDDPLDEFFASMPKSKTADSKPLWKAPSDDVPDFVTQRAVKEAVEDPKYIDHRFSSVRDGVRSAVDEIASARKILEDEQAAISARMAGSKQGLLEPDPKTIVDFGQEPTAADFRAAPTSVQGVEELGRVDKLTDNTDDLLSNLDSAIPQESNPHVLSRFVSPTKQAEWAKKYGTAAPDVLTDTIVPVADDTIADVASQVSDGGTRVIRRPALTKEAQELVASEGVPAFVTKNLKKIAKENGIEVLAEDTPNSIVARLKDIAEQDAAFNSNYAKQLSTYNKSIKEFNKLSAAADSLKSMPDTLKKFRAMKSSKAEEIIAALDIVGTRPEFKNMATHFDGMLEDLGLKVDGSLGTKAKAIWETTNNPRYFKEVNKAMFDMEKAAQWASEVGQQVDLDGNTIAAKATGEAPPLPKSAYEYVTGKPETTMPSFGTKGSAPSAVRMGDGIFASGGVAVPATAKKAGRKGGHPFWRKTVDSVTARGSSKLARTLGLGIIGSGVAYEMGGSIADMAMSGLFMGTVSNGRIGTLSRIRQGVANMAPKLGRGLGKAAPRFGSLAVRIDGSVDNKAKDDGLTARKRIDEINAVAPRIEDLAYQAVEPLVGHQDEFAKSMYDTIIASFRALQSFLPKDPGNVFSKSQSLWVPNAIQRLQIGKAIAVWNDPVGAIMHVTSSKVPDPFTVSVIKAVVPGLYTEMQSELLLKLSDPAFLNSLDIPAQTYYSVITGVPIHSSMSARSIAQGQELYRAKKEQQLAQKGSGGRSGGSGGRPAKTEPPTLGQSLIV